MAIQIKNTYSGRTDTTDPNYPYGKGRNVVGGVEGTGTPFEADWYNNLEGFLQGLLLEAGVTPDGDVDNANSSQLVEAVKGLEKSAEKVVLEEGFSVKDKFDGLEFDTVEDAKSYSKIDKLLGCRVYLKDRQAYFSVVETSSVTPNDLDVIQSSANSSYSYDLEIRDVCNVINFGAVDGANSGAAVNEANNKSKSLGLPLEIPFGNSFLVNSVDGLNNKTIGGGEIAGYVSGVKPTYEELKLEDVTGRANLINSYWLSSLSFDGGFIGDVKLKDIKITSNPFNSGKITAAGCSTLGSQFKAEDGGVTVADDIYSVNSTGVGIHAHKSGMSIVDNCVIVGSSNRGLYCQHGGTISAVNAKVYDTGTDAVAILYGGNINVSSGEIDKTSGHGLVVNYGGSIEATNATINDTAQSSVTCESGGAIFVKFASISNSMQSALTTSFGGIINADEVSIDGVAGIAMYALGGGEVNAELATVTNATGQYIARAIGTGKVNYESPSVTGYGEELYSPRFNMIGNGAAIITNNGDSSKSGVESNYFSFGMAEDKTISSGSINATKSYHNVDTEGGAATDTLTTINGGFEGMRLILNAKNSSRTVTINSSDNIRLDVDKGDFSMTHELDKIELMYNRLGLWCELSRSNNQN